MTASCFDFDGKPEPGSAGGIFASIILKRAAHAEKSIVNSWLTPHY
jgi:hypothetical protein